MNMQVPLGMGGVGVFVSLDFSFAMKQSTPLRTMIMIAIWFQKSPRVALSDSMIPSLPNPKKKKSPTFWSWWESGCGICDDMTVAPSSGSGWNPIQKLRLMHFPRGILGVGTQLLVLMVWPMVWMLESPWGWTYQRVFSPFYWENSSVKNEKDTGNVLYSCLNSMA